MTSRLRIQGCLCLLAFGCSVQSWQPSELQLDILGADLHDEDHIRICVEDLGMVEAAVGNGRIAFTGLPADTKIRVTVDALSSVEEDTGLSAQELRFGRAGPHDLSAAIPWMDTEWTTCTEDCSPCQTPGDPIEENTESRVLAIRFVD